MLITSTGSDAIERACLSAVSRSRSRVTGSASSRTIRSSVVRRNVNGSPSGHPTPAWDQPAGTDPRLTASRMRLMLPALLLPGSGGPSACPPPSRSVRATRIPSAPRRVPAWATSGMQHQRASRAEPVSRARRSCPRSTSRSGRPAVEAGVAHNTDQFLERCSIRRRRFTPNPFDTSSACCQVSRIAPCGSRRAARSAGLRPAMSAITNRVAATATSVGGSAGLTS